MIPLPRFTPLHIPGCEKKTSEEIGRHEGHCPDLREGRLPIIKSII